MAILPDWTLTILAFIRNYILKFSQSFSKRAVESQLDDLKIEINNIEVWENSEENIPDYIYLKLKFRNLGDLQFKIKRLTLEIQASAESSPYRKRSKRYNLVRIDEDATILNHSTEGSNPFFGYFHTESTNIERRKKDGNVQDFSAEIQSRPWIRNPERFYIKGIVIVQKHAKKPFSETIYESDINFIEQ